MSNFPVQGAQVVSRIASLLRLVGRSAGGHAAGRAGAGIRPHPAHRAPAPVFDGRRGAAGPRPRHRQLGAGPGDPVDGLGGLCPVSRWRTSPGPACAGWPKPRARAPSSPSAAASETVCLLREEGSFPVRSFVLHEGVRFPLGVASREPRSWPSCPRPSRKRCCRTGRPTLEPSQPGTPPAMVRANLDRTRLAGYSVNPGLVLEGSWGMGAAVFDRSGRPAWALSLTGIEPRFKPERQEELGGLLMAEAHRITQQLGGGEGPRPAESPRLCQRTTTARRLGRETRRRDPHKQGISAVAAGL